VIDAFPEVWYHVLKGLTGSGFFVCPLSESRIIKCCREERVLLKNLPDKDGGEK